MKRGKVIVFEGISGTGKETQAKLLQRYLAKKKIQSQIIFHPSPELKPLLKKAKSVSEQIELLVNDRKNKVRTEIRPALEAGKWVISLRNYISARVYQNDKNAVKNIDIQPDYLFYFDIDPKTAMKRIESRGESRGMYEKINLLQEKRRKYQEILKDVPHTTINAGKSIDEVHRNIVQYIT